MERGKEGIIPLDEEKLKKLGNNIEKYIGYKYQYELLQERINKAIEYIKNNWYSKNTRNIDELHSLGDWRLDLLNILQGKDENK